MIICTNLVGIQSAQARCAVYLHAAKSAILTESSLQVQVADVEAQGARKQKTGAKPSKTAKLAAQARRDPFVA